MKRKYNDEDDAAIEFIFNYDKHCVVGIAEFELYKHNEYDSICSSVQTLGDERCICEYESKDDDTNFIYLVLKNKNYEPIEGDRLADVMIYHRDYKRENFRLFKLSRSIFRMDDGERTLSFHCGLEIGNYVRVTVRLLSERPKLFNPLTNTGIIQIGDMKFKINREFLSSCSSFFNTIFNSDSFVEKSSKEVVLKTMNPDAFTDFLLILHTSKLLENDISVLPDTQNIDAILELADFFDVKYIKHECAEFLKTAHDIPVSERFNLVNKYRLKRITAFLFDDMDVTEYQKNMFNIVPNASLITPWSKVGGQAKRAKNSAIESPESPS